MRCMSDMVLCGFFACCLIGVVLCSVTSAETIQIGRLPLKPRAAGFVMTVEMEAVAGNGYQPLELKFSPLGKAFTRDHRLQVVIEPRHGFRTELDYEYRRSMTLPEGAAVAHGICLCAALLPLRFDCGQFVRGWSGNRTRLESTVFHDQRRVADTICRSNDIVRNHHPQRCG